MVDEACGRLEMDRADYRFSRREVRTFTGWSYDQVRVHLDRLVDMEYLLVHRGGRGQSFVYELLYDGKGHDGNPFLIGLIDIDALKEQKEKPMTKSLGGQKKTLGDDKGKFGAPLGGHSAPIGASLGIDQNERIPFQEKELSSALGEKGKNTYIGVEKNMPSYSQTGHTNNFSLLAAKEGEG